MKFRLVILSILLFVCFFSSKSEAENNLQSINLKSVGNARELGGYYTTDGKQIKHGVLLRTAALNKISSDDLTRLTKDYNLSLITDLRMSYEAAAKPDPVIDGVKYVNLRVIDENLFGKELEKKLNIEGDAMERLRLIVDSGILSQDMYVNFISTDYGKKAYREFFRELINLPPERSLLFHCTQGKDRTGIAAMLILSALGVSEEIILEDFLLTNIFNADLIAGQRKMLLSRGIKESELEKYMIILDEVNPKLMNKAIEWLKENYGSPLGYITKELGVSEAEIEALKAKFLEN